MPSGRTTQRGYGAAHQAERRRWEPVVRSGRAICWRCTERIHPDAAWDLGHDDHDRSRYRGPEHQHCNRQAAGRNTPHHTTRRPAEPHPGEM